MRFFPLLLLAGCASTIDASKPPPDDWPQLEVVYYKASPKIFDAVCRTVFLGHTFSCAEVNFEQKKCTILVREGQTLTSDTDRHERDHCRGLDHPGDTTMRDAWIRYKDPSKR